jgi:molecular chaperone DnaJ
MSDYYKILEVGKDANQDEIKKSYRNLCKKYHPDVSREENTEVKFREIQEAYDVLSDEQKRREYDTYGSSGGNPFGGGRHQSHGFNMDDIFSQFGDIFGGRYGQPKQRTRKGNDLRVQLTVNLEEVIMGCTKKVKYKRQVPCTPCNGKGGSELKNCLSCNGTGQRNVTQQTPFGIVTQTMPCNNCNSSGQIVSNPCKSCKGDGTVLTEETIDINLPKGVASGMNLTMQGNGNHVRSGQPGDLQILIDEIKHPKFRREGNDLHCEEWISIPDAVLGRKLNIPTIQGDVNLTIEPGCESGKVFNANGKGVPVLANNGQIYGTGNLYIRVNVKIPKTISDEEKEIYLKLQNK